MHASPVEIFSPLAVFGVCEEIDHNPVLAGEIRITVGDEFIPLHPESVPPLTGGHAPLSADTSYHIDQFGVSPRLPAGRTDRPQGSVNRGAGQKI
jgi:hypothetical protein